MRRGLHLIVGLLATLAWSTSLVRAQEEQTVSVYVRLVNDTLNNVYLPAHQQFKNATKALSESTTMACQVPSIEQLELLRAHYSDVINAFSSVELYRLGAVMQNNRVHRLFYWPDKRRVGERQLRKLLSSSETLTIDEALVAEKSVALQGLPALERLLYGSQTSQAISEQDKSVECLLVKAIAGNLHKMTTDMMQGWVSGSKFTTNLIDPVNVNGDFRSETEVLRSLVTQLIVGIDIVLQRKILPLLDEKNSIKKGPLWRSGHTFEMIELNLNSLRALLFNGGLIRQTRLADELSFEFGAASSLLERLQAMPEFSDTRGQFTKDSISLLKTLSSIVLSIQTTLSERLTAQLGVSAGFNSEDGD